MNTNRLLGLLIGLLSGMFLCCAGTAIALALGGGGARPSSPAAPSEAILQVDVDGAYLNRTFVQNAQGFPSPWPIVAGLLQLQPGNRATFDTRVASPWGRVAVSGRLTFAVEGGRLLIHVAEIKLGAMPITPLLGLFVPDLDEQINSKANEQLLARTGAVHIKLVGIVTDQQAMHLYFAGE